MKKLFAFAIIIIVQFQSKAQNNLSWAYTCGYPNNSGILAFKEDHVGDLYILTQEDSINLINNLCIEKRTQSQTILWNLKYFGNAELSDVEINSSNHAIVIGYYKDTLIIGTSTLISPLYSSAFIFEADDNGNIIWVNSFNPVGNEFRPSELFINQNDEIYFTALISGAHGSCSFHKLDALGNPIHDEYNDNLRDALFSHILVDNAGNIYLTGTCNGGATYDSLVTSQTDSSQHFLIKYDSSFNAQWVIARSAITTSTNNDLASDNNSLYWALWQVYPGVAYGDTIKLLKIDYSGHIQKEIEVARLPPGAYLPIVAMAADSNGNSVYSINTSRNIFLYRYDNQLNLQWRDTIISTPQDPIFGYNVQVECYDSSFYVGDSYYGDSLYIDSVLLLNPNSGTLPEDIFLAKWGFQNTLSVSSLVENKTINVFPNPSDNIFYLQLSDVNETINEVSVSDISGRTIFYSDENIKQIGPFNQKGIYFLKMKTFTGKIYIKKLTVL